MPENGMGWPAIRDALKVRLEALSFEPRVHGYVRFHYDSPLGKAHKDLFFKPDKTLCLWMIHREGLPNDAPSPDDEMVTIRRHTVQLLGFFTHNDLDGSEEAWNAQCDELADDLANGDATFGGTCLTIGGIGYSEPGIVSLWAGSINAHTVTVNLTIEEIL